MDQPTNPIISTAKNISMLIPILPCYPYTVWYCYCIVDYKYPFHYLVAHHINPSKPIAIPKYSNRKNNVISGSPYIKRSRNTSYILFELE